MLLNPWCTQRLLEYQAYHGELAVDNLQFAVLKIQIFTLPFGLICAQDIFQRKVDETFGDLPCVTGIADDIVVYGYNSDFSDHDENLRAVLQHAHETDPRFNLGKCKFRCTQIHFFGHIIGVAGLQPDPRKVGSILSIDPQPAVQIYKRSLGWSSSRVVLFLTWHPWQLISGRSPRKQESLSGVLSISLLLTASRRQSWPLPHCSTLTVPSL